MKQPGLFDANRTPATFLPRAQTAKALVVLVALTFAGVHTIVAQGTAFTYQGRFTDNGVPYTGNVEIQATLWDAVSGGSQIATNVPAQVVVAVTNGLFVAPLDFGANVFTGANRWLEIGVRSGASAGTYTNLTPRQKITAAPYAIFAGGVSAMGLTGIVADSQLSANIARLNGNAVFTGAVVFSNAASQFTGSFAGNGAGVTNVNLATLNSLGAITPNASLFSMPISLGVAGAPFGVVAADVNGDGKKDLISANFFANTLTVVTNNGNGGFTLATNLGVGSGPRALVAADVNGDGHMDLVSANYNVSTLTVLTNNGSGGFSLASTPGVGGLPVSVTAADVNGDGRVDLISANVGDNSLTVVTNNGSGGFTLASSPGVGAYPATVVAADVNGDGRMDLISANSLANTLTVLTNNGSGGFVLAISPSVGAVPFSVAAADVNGDGRVDLISCNRDVNSLWVLINNGSGGFVPTYFLDVGDFPFAMVAADVDGDGRVDLISANRNASTLTVLTNNGSGFGLVSSPAVGLYPYALTAADVNGDGRMDLISANSGDATLSVLLNLPFNFLGNFSGSFAGGNFTGGNFSGGNFNGSGAGITNVNLPLNSAGSISLNSDLFTRFASPEPGGAPFGVVAADVNGDGPLDLITANYLANSLGLLTNNGRGEFTLAMTLGTGSGPRGVVAADVNGDGKVDFVSANYDVSTLSVLTNNGSGGFALASSPGVGSFPVSVTAADVNGDGRMDLISANYVAATLSVLTNNGSAGFTLASSPGVGDSPATVVAADVNGDARMDLISADAGAGTLTVLTNNGSGDFGVAAAPFIGGFPFTVTTADVDGDGRVDLIGANRDFNRLTVLLNHGSGGFVQTYFPSVGISPYALAAADVNGDGRVDLISANRDSDTLTVLTNNGSGFGLVSSPAVGDFPYSVAAADVNGDGRVDLISANSGDGTLSVLLNASLNFLGNFNGHFTGNVIGNGSGLTSLNANNFASGTVPDARLGANVARTNQVWLLGGNTGVAPGANFLGTTDDQSLELRVNGARALRLEPNATSPNVIGGYVGNSVSPGSYGATIAGGGRGGLPHTVSAHHGTIGGGDANTVSGQEGTIAGGGGNFVAGGYGSIGGGLFNNNLAYLGTISGGANHRIGNNANSGVIPGGFAHSIGDNAFDGTIGGGSYNSIGTNSSYVTISGGRSNAVQPNASSSTIGGGYLNTIQPNALYATIPGGELNSAASYAFAAGYRAKANHRGTFVWADSQSADFASTGSNQFCIRAVGGVQLNGDTSIAFGTTTRQMLNLHSTNFGIGIQNSVQYSRVGVGGGFGWYAGGVHNENTFNSGGGTTLMTLTGSGLQLNENTPMFFGSTLSQKLNLYGTAFGIGIQNSVQYSRVAAGCSFAWYAGGSHDPGNFQPGGGTVLMTLTSGGLGVNGLFVHASDRNLKENFAPVQPREMLEKVLALPLSSWNLKADPATRHVGPMAQDFYAAFKLGADDKHIATVDADGVALAAIQGLNQKLEEKDAEIQNLRVRLEKVEQLLTRSLDATARKSP